MKSVLEDIIPSIFVVATPFQALCAIEAIAEFNIAEYKILACVTRSSRDQQLYNFLDKSKVQYEIKDINKARYWKKFLYPLISKTRTNIHRCFLGDPDNIWQRFIAFSYLAKNSDVAYLDDGTKGIPYLMGLRGRSKSKWRWSETLLSYLLKIRFTKSHFTIYSDIAISDFDCRRNSLSHVIQMQQQASPLGVYFIGTNSLAYCEKLNITREEYRTSLEEQLKSITLKYCNQPIIFVPHGRDINDNQVVEICHRLGIQYQIADQMVELFILGKNNKPLAIYANTSTALLNLRLMYPEAKIYNLFCIGDTKSKYYNDYMIYSNYYKNHGIPLIQNIKDI